jgi:two-component system sensor histidine kinase QseC
LRDLGREVALRGPQDLRPLGLRDPPVEVAPVATTIDRLFERIRESLDSERRFTSHAAHEMRTPMAAIRAQAEVARGAEDATERNVALEHVIEACDRAARLVEQLLMLARVDEATAGAGHVACRLDEIARRVLAEQAPWVMEHGASLELAARETSVRGDPLLLEVLVRNLVDNAVRHGGPGAVKVVVEAIGPRAQLAVEDSGRGLSDAEIERLGQRFYRASSVRGTGSGLGLSIAARIAELHAATLTFGRGRGGAGMRVELAFDTRSGTTPTPRRFS